MKNFLKILLKYLFILIFLLLLIFLSVFFYNFLPLLKIYSNWNELKNIIKALIIPVFFHSFYNSLILSIILYNVVLLNHENKNRILKFFIPILITCILVFTVQYYLKPSTDKLTIIKKNDARLLFTPDVFIEHNNKKYLFKSIKKNKIETVIQIKSNNSLNKTDANFSIYHDVNVIFSGNKTYLELINNGKSKKEEFTHQELKSYDILNSTISENAVKYLSFMTSRFLFSKNIYINTLLWFCTSFLLLSMTQLIRLINYPFLSLIYNFLLVIVIYILFYYLFDIYFKIIQDIIPPLMNRELFLCLIILSVGTIVQIIRIIFFRPHELEHE